VSRNLWKFRALNLERSKRKHGNGRRRDRPFCTPHGPASTASPTLISCSSSIKRRDSFVDMNVSDTQERRQGERPEAVRPEQLSPLQLFRSTLEAGHAGVWTWDLRSNLVTWSTNLDTFLGRAEGSTDGTLSLAPQDLPPEEGGLFAAIRQVLQTREPCRLEYRLPGPSGPDERWFEALVTVMVRDGAPV